jgi:exodeoxyribonuclease VII large subunit
LAQRLVRGSGQAVRSCRREIDQLSARLHCISPQEVLKRGYSLTTSKKTGQIIRDAGDVKPGDTLITRLASGQIQSRVEDARQFKLFE